ALLLDEQGAALVRPRRPHPRAAQVSGRFTAMPRAAAGARGRRLRQVARLLVLRQGAASPHRSGRQAVKAADDGGPAAGLQKRGRRARQRQRRRRQALTAITTVERSMIITGRRAVSAPLLPR